MPDLDVVLTQLRAYVNKGESASANYLVSSLHPADSAALVTRMEPDEQRRLFTMLKPEQAADVVEELPHDAQEAIVHDLGPEKSSDIVEAMDSDETADLLMNLPQEDSQAILRLMAPREALEAKRLMAYPKDTAGGIMATEFIGVYESATVQQIRERLQVMGEEESRQYTRAPYIYVLDVQRRLLGVLDLRDLFFRAPHGRAGQIMHRDVVSVPVGLDREEVAAYFRKYNLIALPVIDDTQQLLGIITADDVMDVIHDEASEDLL